MFLLNDIPRPKIFLDANVLLSAVLSETGGSRMLLRLAEVKSIRILISSLVLNETDQALRRKVPDALAHLAILLDQAHCQVVNDAHWTEVEVWNQIVAYLPDAGVVAAAVAAEADYLATLDRQHIFNNKDLVQALPLPVGTPGDCLAWLRTRLQSPYDDSSYDAPSIRGHRLNEAPAIYEAMETQ